jgi:RNA recognition motif-containing protein
LHLGTYVDTQAFLVQEISGRAIRIEFAKRFKKPSPPRPEGPPAGETRHKLYVSNLAWKVRSTHLREFVSENFKPVSARVVFDAPLGRSAGYGFVSFATREEAEAVISALEGKVKKKLSCWLSFYVLILDDIHSFNTVPLWFIPMQNNFYPNFLFSTLGVCKSQWILFLRWLGLGLLNGCCSGLASYLRA